MTESFRLRHVNWIVGFFLLLILGLALGSVLAYIFVTDTFGTKLTYYTIVKQEELGSLRKGAEVFLLGDSVGKVDDIAFVNGKNIKVTMKIRQTPSENIVTNSRVIISQPFAGFTNSHVEIRRGDGTTEILPDANGERELKLAVAENQLNDVGASVSQGMAQIVDNFDRARSSIVWGMNAFRSLSQTSERGVEPALEELRKAISELRASTARTETTLKNTLEDIAETSRTMNDRTKSSSANLDANIEEMEQSIAEANRNMKIAIDKVNRDLTLSLSKFNDVMDDLKKVSKDLPETKDEVDDAVSDADDVIDGLKRHPLLKNHIPQDQGTRQTAPSSVRGGSP
jgi:ABC-type transporter Mla subunit MlaD